MKRKYILESLVILLLIVLSASSCKEELEKSPLDQFDNATFWSSEENALLALTAVYRGGILVNAGGGAPTDWWSWTGLLYLDLASDDAYHRQGENNPFHRLSNGTLTSNLAILDQYWTTSYRRIARCNDFLENVGRVPMVDARKNRLIAEVRFIRAAQYFYLSQHFGSVPLVKQTLSPDEANVVSKAPRQEIVDFVIGEFTAAALDLPRFSDIPSSEIGRASKQAALAYLGRIQLAEELFEEAVNTYKTIIDFGDNVIDPDYKSIFLEANENSKENIFSIQYIPNLLANGVMQHNAPRTMGGYTFINPLASLMESYQFTDGTPFSYTDPRYDYTDLAKGRDPRLKYTMYYNGGPFKDGKYVSHPDSAHSLESIINGALGTRTGYLMKKFIDESVTGSLSTGNGGNTPIIRYAEVLLSYLEAKLEAGHPIDQALLDATINQVRTRASVNMPPITETDPTSLRPILRNERRVELALEGIRFWDLLRWGIADEVLNADFYGHPYPVSTVAVRRKPGQPEDTHHRWWVTTRQFRSGIDEFWPIPQAEININPNLAD